MRGTGPPVLLVMGTTGDAGHFDKVADLLADEFTVLTYDRRGNGRSPAPHGWTGTSVEEQANEAAALLDALRLAPAAVFGTSSGAVFTLGLLVRHPQAVRGAILHEPALGLPATVIRPRRSAPGQQPYRSGSDGLSWASAARVNATTSASSRALPRARAAEN
ncbi:MAG TPA: alpha/beta fold hydrolase [Pseudonocardiaceae bacterium]|nr:alpha/beta fold hydrolase [Pseudonocardiaceae bacterium]